MNTLLLIFLAPFLTSTAVGQVESVQTPTPFLQTAALKFYCRFGTTLSQDTSHCSPTVEEVPLPPQTVQERVVEVVRNVFVPTASAQEAPSTNLEALIRRIVLELLPAPSTVVVQGQKGDKGDQGIPGTSGSNLQAFADIQMPFWNGYGSGGSAGGGTTVINNVTVVGSSSTSSLVSLQDAYNFGGVGLGKTIDASVGGAIDIKVQDGIGLFNGLTITGDTNTTQGMIFGKSNFGGGQQAAFGFADDITNPAAAGGLFANYNFGLNRFNYSLYTAGASVHGMAIGNPAVETAGTTFENFVATPNVISLRVFGVGGVVQNVGLGNPENVVTADSGSIYFRVDGVSGNQQLYVKTTDGVNTGWVGLSPASNSPSWELAGNAGTNSVTDFLGTTDAQDLAFRTNNVEQLRITQAGRFLAPNATDNIFVDGGNETMTGTSNIGIGDGAIGQNTTGISNIALGQNALAFNTTGFSNMAIGQATLLFNNGNTNTAIGQGAGIVSTGNSNTYIGYGAGNTQSAGDNNIVIGQLANTGNGTGSNQLSIGNWIYGDSGNIGIGQPLPTERLDVLGNIRFSGALMPNNVAGAIGEVLLSQGSGLAPIWVATSTLGIAGGTVTANNGLVINPANNVQLGGRLLQNTSIEINDGLGGFFFEVGPNAGESYFKVDNASSTATLGDDTGWSTGTSIVADVSNSELRFSTNLLERMRIESNGFVGIGATTPTERLDVLGNVRFSGALMPNNLAGATGTVLMSQGAGLAPLWGFPIAQIATVVNSIVSVNTVLTGTDDQFQGVNTTGAARTITLPAAANREGQMITIFKTASPNQIDVDRTGGDSINFAPSTYTIRKQTERVTFVSDGLSNWQTIAQDGDFVGTDGLAAGERGLVPTPGIGDLGKILSANGAWVATSSLGITVNNVWSTLGNTGTASTTNFLGTTDNVDLVFRTNNVNRLRITAAGKLLTDDAPDNVAATDVKANFYNGTSLVQSIIQVTNTYSGNTNNDGLQLGVGSGVPVAFVQNRENADMWLGTNGTFSQFFNSNGNVGFGSSVFTPGAKVEIRQGTAGNSGLRFSNLTSADVSALTTNRFLTVDVSGNVVLASSTVSSSTIASNFGFIQNGNSFGTLATIGTNDAFDFALETNGTERMRVTQTGRLVFSNTSGGATNLFVGASSGNETVTGNSNSAFGTFALGALSTGNNNTAHGYGALFTNTTGGNNTAIGYEALFTNGIGINNVAVGYSALFNNGSGSNNAALGLQTLFANTTGGNNTGFGFNALGFNQTGSDNAVFGSNAGAGVVSSSNVSRNTFIGVQSGFNVLTGANNNILLGYHAGDQITTGANNIVLGYDIDTASSTGSNQLTIGNLIFGTGIDGLGTTISSGNIGIGISAPSARLSISGTASATPLLSLHAASNQTSPFVLFTDSLGVELSRIHATSTNLFMGQQSGALNTTGNSNAFFGGSAGRVNLGGSLNTFLGYASGYTNSSGSENTFAGAFAGFANTTGNQNAFFGSNTGLTNNSGASNAFFGADTGAVNSTGSNNSFFGSNAGRNNTNGSLNVFIGTSAGFANTSGTRNSFMGRLAGNANTIGSDNIFIGYQSADSNQRGNANIVIGNDAAGNGLFLSESVIIGQNAGFAATATTTGNVFLGVNSGLANLTGSSSTFIGYGAGSLNTTGSNNIIIGINAGLGTSTQSNALSIGNLIYGMGLDGSDTTISSGNIGIGTSTPLQKLQVFGDIRVGTTGTNGCIEDYAGNSLVGVCSSDENLKTDITNVESKLEQFAGLNFVTYRWNQTAGDLYKKSTETYTNGVLAQQLETIFPELVTTDTKGYKQVNMTALNLYGLKVIQEVADVAPSFQEKLIAWFGKATNGITEFFAKKVTTEELCVGSVCVTEAQFLQMVQNGGVTPVTGDTSEVENEEDDVSEEILPEVVTEDGSVDVDENNVSSGNEVVTETVTDIFPEEELISENVQVVEVVVASE